MEVNRTTSFLGVVLDTNSCIVDSNDLLIRAGFLRQVRYIALSIAGFKLISHSPTQGYFTFFHLGSESKRN